MFIVHSEIIKRIDEIIFHFNILWSQSTYSIEKFMILLRLHKSHFFMKTLLQMTV